MLGIAPPVGAGHSLSMVRVSDPMLLGASGAGGAAVLVRANPTESRPRMLAKVVVGGLVLLG